MTPLPHFGGGPSDRQIRSLARSMNARMSAVSLRPFADSTPDDTSTAGAPVSLIAAATFSGVSPPASSHGAGATHPATTDQSKLTALPRGLVASAGGFASNKRASAPIDEAGRSAGPAS